MWLIGAISLIILGSGAVRAADNARQVSVTINRGDTYVIKDLSKDSTPAVRVIDNPGALIVHSEIPGQLVLLGAEAGQWAIDVKGSDGQKVTYKVSINSIANPSDKLAPGKTPPPIGGPSFGLDTSAPPEPAALDSGAGRLTPSAAAPVTTAAAISPSAGAGLTAAAVRATAPSSEGLPVVPNASASSPTTLADNSAAPLPAVASSAPPPPAPSAPASWPSADPNRMISNQTLGAQALPPEKFNTDPLASTAPMAESAPHGNHYIPDDGVVVASGSSRIYDFSHRLRRISIADTSVADVQVINPYQINLIGHKTGFTTLALWDSQGHYLERQIRVDPFGREQVLLNVIVAELNRGRMEQQAVNWTVALPKYNVSLTGIGPGGAATPYSGSSNLQASTIFGLGSANQTVVSTSASGTLPPEGALIPLLLSSNVNYGLAAGNSNVTTQTLFNFLENHSLAKILAEPHLLANSGEKAEFLSGGEIPIVIAQALNTSIVFKQFGTSVVFVPTVVGRDDIELEVKPEVSQPDFAHGVSMFGFVVPAFVTRRAQTVVRLRDNQTLIIAGLILHTKTSEVDKTPYLGDIPYVGTLFKHTNYQEADTDLVMSVTPQLVEPLPSNGEVALPTDRGPMTAEELRTRRLTDPDVSRPRF
jgi:pilus assembly protein CpaC